MLGAAAVWAVVWISLLLTVGGWWVRYRFGDVSFDQVIANLPGYGGGEGVGDSGIAVEAVLWCVVFPALASLAISWGVLWGWRRLRRRQLFAVAWRRRLVAVLIPTLAVLTSAFVFLESIGLPQYVVAAVSGQSFASYYVTPEAEGESEERLNLITIYMESVENTFTDEDIFGENLISAVDEATTGDGWSSYDLGMYPGGGWTMAGIVSTQCGIPLKNQSLILDDAADRAAAGVSANAFGESVSRYLPGAVCLGDVLSDAGYTNVFYGGADTSFAGKQKFLEEHGYTDVSGLARWTAEGAQDQDISGWGLSDQALVAKAQTEIAELAAADEPFNFTMITLDTHEPGNVYSSCGTDDELAMKRALRCSSAAVAELLSFLNEGGYLDDTVVVVMGDHLKQAGQGTQYYEELSSAQDRTIFYRVHTPSAISFSRDSADQLSVLASTLDLLGLGSSTGRAGLGVSFLGDYDLSGTLLELTEDEYEAALDAPSADLYRMLWGGEGYTESSSLG